MKLLRLKINKNFRSLRLNQKGEGFEVNFLKDIDIEEMCDFMPYCLVGRNGSGKSNILEALAAIFYHIECIYLNYKPEGFEGEGEFKKVHNDGFFAEQCTPDAFELEYKIPVKWKLISKTWDEMKDVAWNELIAHIEISKQEGEAPKIVCKNKELFDGKDFFKIDEKTKEETNELSRLGVKEILPDFIVGYSSGENEILSLPFFKMRFINYDEYEDSLRNETGYSQPEGRLVYLDAQHSQAVFLTNYLMQNESILKPIYDAIGVKAISQFRIIIRQGVPIAKFRTEELTTALKAEELTINNKDVFELTYNLKRRKDTDIKDYKAIDKLRNCATSQFLDSENDILYLDYFIDKKGEMKNAFQNNFESAFELFRTFQILLTLNLHEVDIQLKQDLYKSTSLYVNETVPILASDKRLMRIKDFIIEKESTNNDILSKSLSDGEHQYLHAIGICLLFKNSNSLFLLDEPETHFNPDWRASFISTLRDSLAKDEKGKNYMRELLITSHSPFIVSDCKEDNVLVFKKDKKTGVVIVNRPGFNTFGASVNQITIQLFNRVDTIGDLANEKVLEFEKRIQTDEDLETLKVDIFNTLGDSIERTILINQLIEKRNKG